MYANFFEKMFWEINLLGVKGQL